MSLFPFNQRLVNHKENVSYSPITRFKRQHQATMSHNISQEDLSPFDDSKIFRGNASMIQLAPIQKQKYRPPLLRSAVKVENKSLGKLVSAGKYDREPKSKEKLISLLNNRNEGDSPDKPVLIHNARATQNFCWKTKN